LRPPDKGEGANELALPRQPRQRVKVTLEGCREERVTKHPNSTKRMAQKKRR